MHEFVPKSVAPTSARPTQRSRDRLNNIKKNQRKKAVRDMERRREKEHWSPPDQRLALWELAEKAKENLYQFTLRTGRIVNIEEVHKRGVITGRNVWDYIPNRSFAYVLPLRVAGRKGINRTLARKIAVSLGVPYWNEMTADEIRAVIVLLIVKRGGVTEMGLPVDEV